MFGICLMKDSVALNVAAVVTYGRCRIRLIELRLIVAKSLGLPRLAFMKDWRMQRSGNKME